MYHPFTIKAIRIYFAVISTLFPSLSCLSAYRFFHRPVAPGRKHKNTKPLPRADTFCVSLDNTRTLQVYSWGEEDAPAVLLVHGWSTNPYSLSHFTFDLLEAGYRVISYDALGHGRSSHILADLADWADSVRAVTHAVGPVTCIIAHSFGGAAVTVASKQGLNTQSLILLAPIHDILSAANAFGERLGIPPAVIDCMQRYTWDRNRERFSSYGTDWHDILHSSFHVPTLIFHDEGDREIPITHSRQLCREWPWAQLRPTHGLGHRKILDDPLVVKESVTFIQNMQQ